MNLLFIHQNFPGQFKHLAPALAAQAGVQVAVLTLRKDLPAKLGPITIHRYSIARGNGKGVHPWVTDVETKVIRGEAAMRAALVLREQGYTPDVIVAHPGWGESLFLKEVWPKARLGLYAEFYYGAAGTDVGFDPEFVAEDPVAGAARMRIKNLNNLLHFEVADAALSPTEWQRSSFPQPFRQRISVAHDGVDTQNIRPDPKADVQLPSGRSLDRTDEVITFVNRNIEPYRGCHVFLRALPALLAQRPKAQVVIVGGEGISYGPPAPNGQSWKQVFMAEIEGQVDLKRIHFVGTLPHPVFSRLLQVSTVHVYLTYPFVLSWSLLEAMSSGCAIVASDTPPVLEVLTEGETGRLVNFFDQTALVARVCELLDDPPQRARLGANAREVVCQRYDLASVCLPAQLAWVLGLAPA